MFCGVKSFTFPPFLIKSIIKFANIVALLLICSCDNAQGVLLIAPVVRSTETRLLCCFMSYSFSDGRESMYFVPTPTRNQRVIHCHQLALLSGQSFTLRQSSIGISFPKVLFILILLFLKLFEFSAEEIIVFVLVTTLPFVSPFNILKGQDFSVGCSSSHKPLKSFAGALFVR